MNTNENLDLLLQGTASVTEAISAENDLKKEYPAFMLPTALLLKHWGNDLTPGQKTDALKRIALFSPDPLALSRLEQCDRQYAGFYPPEPEQETPSTDSAIETFLENYGGADATSDAETAMLERLIFNPVPQDYAETLRKDDSESEIPADETITRIDSFISAHPTTQAPLTPEIPESSESRPEPPEQVDPNSLLSESLAKIYIKQHRYDKAYEIISQLSLNYPEKSIYFADQLRFLKKIMLIESYKKRKAKH